MPSPTPSPTHGPAASTAPLPMIEKRRIEAEILKLVYDTLEASHGADVATRTVANAVKASAIAQGREMAAAVGGNTSMETFIKRQELWRMSGALDIEVDEQTETKYIYRVTRCRYAEMYRDMGLGEIGHLLSCMRDATFCEGYDPRISLQRTQTIMQGASHCDFAYFLDDTAGDRATRDAALAPSTDDDR